MNYQTTKIKPLKSYPTFQFHAYTDSENLPADDVFKICILEIFRWLRLRLNNFSEIPAIIDVPEPENYRDFDECSLCSFSLSLGFNVSAVYIEKLGIWSFNITESDMGANIGTDTERLPVQGRIFSTDVALRKQKDFVEFGVRTTCSEPYDVTADCEVFRPTFVKVLSQNEDIGFRKKYRLDGRAFEVSTKNDAENLSGILGDEHFDMPVVLIAETELIESETELPEIQIPDTRKLQLDFGIGVDSFSSDNLSVDMSKAGIELKNSINVKKRSTSKQINRKATAGKARTELKRSETIDYQNLAKSLTGFALVCKINENCFKILKNKNGIDIRHGDVLVCCHGRITDEYKYPEFENRLMDFYKELKVNIKNSLKRNPYSFGNIAFISDARLLEIDEKRRASLTLEEECELLNQENDELKRQIKEYEQRNADIRFSSDELRMVQKRVKALENEYSEAKERELAAVKRYEMLEYAYRSSSEITAFYRQKAQFAAYFPTNKNEVCEWAEKEFSDTILIAPRAKSEMRKYSGALSVAMLCDGIYYLNGYARYRCGEISKEQLELYAEGYGWTAGGCGKEALKVRRDDYIATVDGVQYLLDQHIKYGVNSQQLIRIYFCWDELKRKVIIGYMPGHLATVKQST